MTDSGDVRFRHLETKVGIFIAIAIAACLAVVLFIGFESDLFTSNYRLSFTVDRGTGFSRGMPIKLSGFRIGRLDQITLTDEARVRIDILVGHKYQRWIRDDSVARLSKEGLVGDAVIEIDSGNPQQRMLMDGDTITYEKTKSIEEHIEEISERVKPVLLEVSDIISYVDDPQGDIKQTLAHVEALTGELQTTRIKTDRLLDSANGDINRLSTEAERTFAALNVSLARLDRILASLETAAPTILARANRTFDNLEQLSSDLSDASAQVAPRVAPLMQKTDQVLNSTGELVESAQQIWLLSPKNKDAPVPHVAPGDSNE
jgi:phospholipid/cholesterol/gamma-HCH transport system substrate-binding protein